MFDLTFRQEGERVRVEERHDDYPLAWDGPAPMHGRWSSGVRGGSERSRHEPGAGAPPARRDDGPLPAPVLLDVEADLWRAGYRDWDDEGQEFRIDGDTFTGQRAAWERSQQMVAERKRQRSGQ